MNQPDDAWFWFWLNGRARGTMSSAEVEDDRAQLRAENRLLISTDKLIVVSTSVYIHKSLLEGGELPITT